MGYGFEQSLRPNMVALCGCIDGHNITGRGGGGGVDRHHHSLHHDHAWPMEFNKKSNGIGS